MNPLQPNHSKQISIFILVLLSVAKSWKKLGRGTNLALMKVVNYLSQYFLDSNIVRGWQSWELLCLLMLTTLKDIFKRQLRISLNSDSENKFNSLLYTHPQWASTTAPLKFGWIAKTISIFLSAISATLRGSSFFKVSAIELSKVVSTSIWQKLHGFGVLFKKIAFGV